MTAACIALTGRGKIAKCKYTKIRADVRPIPLHKDTAKLIAAQIFFQFFFMSNTRKILASMLPTLIGLAVGMLACALIDRCAPERPEAVGDTVRVVVTDTVRVERPVARDSVVVRYKTAWLKQVKAAEPQGKAPGEQGKADASKSAETQVRADASKSADAQRRADASEEVEVEIPITQKVYADSTYKAWVSGWEPSLDSIEVYQKTEYITINPKPKRWSIGVTAGYGITPKGMQPYVGVGVTYSIKSF